MKATARSARGADGECGAAAMGEDARAERVAARYSLWSSDKRVVFADDGEGEDGVAAHDNTGATPLLVAEASTAPATLRPSICGLHMNGRGNTTRGRVASGSSSARIRSNSKRARCVTHRRVR